VDFVRAFLAHGHGDGAIAMASHGLVGAPLPTFALDLDYSVRNVLGCPGDGGGSARRMEAVARH